MEAQRLPCPPMSLNDQPIQIGSCLQSIPPASDLSPNPVILQSEQAVSQTIYLKALTIPLYPPIQAEYLQPNNKLLPGQTSINLDSSNVPLILNPFLQSGGMDHLQTVIQKEPGTISIITGLPVFPQNSAPGSQLGSPSKCKNVGKCICKHCGRDCLKPSVLEKHIRSHTGERPFPCTTCGIAFKTQSNLYKHKRTQTHVNNARLSSESDSSMIDDHPRAMVKHTAMITSEKHSLDTSGAAVNAVFLVSENQWTAMDSSCRGQADQIVKEIVKDSVNPLQRWKTQEQRSPTISKPSQLQRQQATYSEKLWDSRSPDHKLKKCESTDSGYFSRSDSVEQQMLSPSPLHSLCEHSTETEEEGNTAMNNLGCIAENISKTDTSEKATGTLTLEKKKLEEHISKLISHNKTVVDDTQLDSVRPRKTVLSKQGSIDLPMPYTYKDSFHFDLRPPDINRKKKLALCSAKSTFTPVERSKPLFFHSVPTQFSTTIDCVPVTRSNSMPFIESTRRTLDHVDILKLPPSIKTSSDTSVSGLLHGKHLAATVIDFPANHPRALVRQAAVDDLALSSVNESSSSLEETKNAKKLATGGEVASTKCKKNSQRKLKMFSQEKWQVYGDETFKKIYQKMKSSQTTKKLKGNEVTDISTKLSDGKGTVSCDDIPLVRDRRGSTSGDLLSFAIAVTAELNTKELEDRRTSVSSPFSQAVSSQEGRNNLAGFMEMSCAVNDYQHREITKTFVMHRSTEIGIPKQDLSSNSQIVPLSASCKSSLQYQQSIGRKPQTQSDISSPHNSGLKVMPTQEELIKCVMLPEAISTSEGDGTAEKEGFQLTQKVSLSNPCNSEPVQESQKVPSERKKLKVDKLKSKENIMLKSGLDASGERTVNLLDFQKLDVVPMKSVPCSTKEEQKAMVGINVLGSSTKCEATFQYPIMTSGNKNYVSDIAHTSAISMFEHHRTERTNKYAYSLYTWQRLTKQPCPIISRAGSLSKTGNTAQTPTSTQHFIFDPVTPCLTKNDFLPKYILKYSQEIDKPEMPLILAEPENMSYILQPGTSNSSPFPVSNNGLVSTSATDVFLCPLQLEMSNPSKTTEPTWDVQTVWKPLVVCPPAVLETTRMDKKSSLQNIRQKETMGDVRSAPSRDNLDADELTQEVGGHTIVCTSLTLGKKKCFTTVYAGGIFISSDRTGQNSSVQLIHSGNSSVLSVSSLVERTVLCGDPKKIKDIDSFERLQDLPTGSGGNSECLCHSSKMLYCHVLCTQEKEFSLPSQASDMNLSFPTLNAEPQLTWCCLSRNLPLPIEQKGKKDSAYSSLHTCKNEHRSSKHCPSFCKMDNSREFASGDRKMGALKTPVPLFPAGLQTEKVMSLSSQIFLGGLFHCSHYAVMGSQRIVLILHIDSGNTSSIL